MPELSASDIEQIATLARLNISDGDMDRYAKDLSVVFEYMEVLNEVDIAEVSETCQVTGLEDVFREDEVSQCDEEVKKKLIEAFPERVGNLLKVPAVFE